MSEEREKWPWRFPENGTPFNDLEEDLLRERERNINYETDIVLGFPGTTPLPESVVAAQMFMHSHANNIGLHTLEGASERGFDGTQELERAAVYMAADLTGAPDPSGIDGYICSGGTAGNDHGMWLGIQQLMSQGQDPYGVVVLTSNLAHYSIVKNFGRLLKNGMPKGSDIHRLEVLQSNENGELTADIVEDAVRRYLHAGFGRFLLVLTAGTTNLGSVDQVKEINNLLTAMMAEDTFLRATIHVDAAYGGFVLPFTEPEMEFGFQNWLVNSVIVDAHKMGYAPYPAGIFLARKGLLEKHCVTEAPYIKGHHDYTVCGSRPGTAAAACWAAFRTLGRKGYIRRMEDCMVNLAYLREELQKFNSGGETHVSFYPARMNVQAVRFSKTLTDAFAAAGKAYGKEFCLPDVEGFPTNLTCEPSMGQNGNGSTVFRFLTTPTLTREKLDIFLQHLGAAWAARERVTQQ